MTKGGVKNMANNQSWIMHPGFYLKEEMDARSWSQRDLAFILGVPEQAVNLIVSGKRGISADMAQALGVAFDVHPDLFANLQKDYEMSQAQLPDPGVALRAKMQNIYPVREMIKRGWITATDAGMLESQLVRFFGVEDADDIPLMAHAARKSCYDDVPAPQLAWLFRVRQIATSITVPKYSEKALREALVDLEALLIAPEEARHVPRILGQCGVRFIVVEKLPHADIDGVCLWLDDDSPVIGMSLKRDTIDNFWFVLRHEIEHVLQRHGKETDIIDVDLGSFDTTTLPPEEQIANAAAADFCSPTERLDNFMKRKHPFYYEKDVLAFARTVQRHPGLVIGQMHFRMKRHDYLARHLAKVRAFVIPGSITDGWGQAVPISL
jgi:HTH-type transcriptional regulator/antitoxin HigA